MASEDDTKKPDTAAGKEPDISQFDDEAFRQMWRAVDSDLSVMDTRMAASAVHLNRALIVVESGAARNVFADDVSEIVERILFGCEHSDAEDLLTKYRLALIATWRIGHAAGRAIERLRAHKDTDPDSDTNRKTII